MLPQLVPELVETLCTGQVGLLLEPLQDILITQAPAALRTPHPILVAWFDQALNNPHWEVRMWAVVGSNQVAPQVLETTLRKSSVCSMIRNLRGCVKPHVVCLTLLHYVLLRMSIGSSLLPT
ncbi:hypothetical protein KDA_30860 [Dictyobacter alpinus]|uniref:Uncharacterized protein n=1 Tax=Dictyobacter alpinus TaxID=2014873 RepID=A0A402B8H1_9CHLR|nr:hypothetical protein KDA_30860 [Dictyobacter alpinus]